MNRSTLISDVHRSRAEDQRARRYDNIGPSGAAENPPVISANPEDTVDSREHPASYYTAKRPHHLEW